MYKIHNSPIIGSFTPKSDVISYIGISRDLSVILPNRRQEFALIGDRKHNASMHAQWLLSAPAMPDNQYHMQKLV